MTVDGIALSQLELRDWSPRWGSDLSASELPTFVFPRGSWVAETESSGPHAVSPNIAVLLRPGEPYRTDPSTRCNSGADGINVSREVLRDVLRDIDPDELDGGDGTLETQSVVMDAPTFSRQRMLFRYAGTSAHVDPLAVEVASLELVSHLARRATRRRSADAEARRQSTTRRHRHIALEGQRYLSDRFTSAITLQEVARVVGVAPTYFCRVFREETGFSVFAFVTELRLRAALDRLPDHRGNLTDLGLALGYSSGNHFSDAFRRRFGIPPSRMLALWDRNGRGTAAWPSRKS